METLSPLKYQMPAFGPYLLGQIGLVGNITLLCPPSSRMLLPYLLGQIGLGGNFRVIVSTESSVDSVPYLLGQIGLVGKQKKGF